MTYSFNKVKVLVVESSRPMFELVKGVLSLFTVPGNNIYSAFSVEEGFKQFRDLNHDLLLVDWLENPDRGILLTRMIRTDKASPNPFVPIIMTAGSSHYKKVVKARDSGISEYLVKPFSGKTLAERITRVIEKPRLFVVSDAYTGPDRRNKLKEYTGPERRKGKISAVPVKFKNI